MPRASRMVPGEWKTMPRKQRTHTVEAREDGYYVQLAADGDVDSDKFACNHDCGERVLAGGVKPGIKTGGAGLAGGDGKAGPEPYSGPTGAPWAAGFKAPKY